MGTSGANRQSPLRLFPAQTTPRLYDRVVEVLRARHYSRRTEQAYVHWIRRFILFHAPTHLRQLTEGDVNRFPDPSAGGRLRHPDGTGVAGAQGRRDHNLGWDFGEDSRLPPEVVGLTVIRRENASESLWLTVDADYVRPVSAEHLQARISAKNGKVQRYVRASPEFWLIVVFDSLRFSGTFDLHSPAFNCVYESVFKRTFVFDTFSGTVRELTTCNPQAAA